MNQPASGYGSSGHRYKGIRPLSRIARSLLTPSLRKQGFAQHEIVTRWSTIVGVDMAQHTLPQRLRFPGSTRSGGTLFILVEGPFALELQHSTPQIIERLNTYFGYAAIEKLVLRQGPIPNKLARPKRPTRTISSKGQSALDTLVAPTRDTGLRSALNRLGQSIFADEEALAEPSREKNVRQKQDNDTK